MTRWSWPRRPTSPARCCSRWTVRAPAWPACCHSKPHRPSWWRWPSMPRKRRACASRAVLVLLFPRFPARRKSRSEHPLLACTFVHQKFPGRVPQGAVLLRAFFGGHSADALLGETDDRLTERACLQLSRILGPLPEAAETVVRRWPLVHAAICRRPPGPHGGTRIAIEHNARSSSCGERLPRSGIARSYPSGSGHCPIARGQPYPSPVLNTMNVSNITKDQTLLLTAKFAVARSECALTSSFSC